MEQNLSAWVENQKKRALGRAGFRPKFTTVDHLVILRVIMEDN